MTAIMDDAERSQVSANEDDVDGALDQPRRILVADDEHLVAAGLTASLRQLGYDVIGPASDGASAITLCESGDVDMALLDIRMPGSQSGLDAATVIYEQHRVPVVIVSAYSDQQYIAQSTTSGVFGYLLKPVTQDQLRVSISVAWHRYRNEKRQSATIDSLNQRLEQRKIIEQAKWALVSKSQLSEPDAMRLLQRDARNNRRPLIDVATDVIERGYLIDES